MSLSTLRLVVFDTLSVNLDLQSLLALSSKSKSLHHQVNQVLYREPAFRWFECFLCSSKAHLTHQCASKALEKSLSVNPTNSFFVRKHKTFNVEILQKIWSRSRLTLTELYISDVWFMSSNEQEIAECVFSKNEDTYVHEIVLDWPADDDYRWILGMLQLFLGLSILRIKGPLFSCDHHSTPDSIISQLYRPQLEQLHLSSSDLIPTIGDKLPNLKVLTIYRKSVDGCSFYNDEAKYYTLDHKWARLSALKNRKIHFIQKRFL